VTLFSLAGSRNCVNRTAKPENDLEKKMTATSGRRCLEQYGRFSRVGSWERMFSDLLIGTGDWYSTKCKLIWKMKGTSYNRMYFQLVPSTHRTEGIEFGLLHTPRATMIEEPNENFIKRMGDRSENCYPHLSAQVVDFVKKGMLPTPTAMDSTGATANMKSSQVKEGSMHSVTLSRFVGMLPTPRASDVEGGISNPNQISEKNGRFVRTSDKTGTEFGAKLRDVAHLLPTPTASDYHARGDQPGWDGSDLVSTMHKITGADGKTSQLNPRFVAEMMGFPPNWTESPFQSGDKNP
jgi:hypothetical protein